MRNCPKLNTFEVKSTFKHKARYNVRYCRLLYKLRDLVTVMEINVIDYAESRFGSLVEFITSFPRLTKIRGVTNRHFNNFQKFLPVLSRLTKIEYMRMGADENKVDNAESYLAEKTKEEQDILFSTLSNLKTFKFHSINGFSVDSLKFASKYLTGLQVFRFKIERLNYSQLQDFCDSVLDLFCSTSDGSNVFVNKVHLETLSMCFLNIVNKVFSLAQTKSILNLKVEEGNNRSIYVALYKGKYERGITLVVARSHNPQDIASYLFSQNVQLKKVDEFRFTISGRNKYGFVVNNDTYDMLLQEMLLLKDVTLDIPASYSDDSITYNGKSYTQVENLTLQATPRGKIQ